jgi:hypothetical protein
VEKEEVGHEIMEDCLLINESNRLVGRLRITRRMVALGSCSYLDQDCRFTESIEGCVYYLTSFDFVNLLLLGVPTAVPDPIFDS